MSKGRVGVKPRAEADLDEHFLYIATDSLDSAVRLLHAARLTYRRVAEMPGIGAPCPWLNPRIPELRRITIDGFPNHVAYYRPTADGIEVIRVLHGARDRETILARE